MAFEHQVYSAFKLECKEEDGRNAKREKLFSRTSNFSASSNVNEMKPTQSDFSPLVDGIIVFGTVHYWRTRIITINTWQWVRNAYIMYVWENDKQSQLAKPTRAVYMDVPKIQSIAALRKPNGRIQSRSQRKHSNGKSMYWCYCLLHMVPIWIQSGYNRLNEYVFHDSGSVASVTEENLQEKLQPWEKDFTLYIVMGLHSQKRPLEAFFNLQFQTMTIKSWLNFPPL